MMIIIENCANSVLSCIQAERGGAHRIELCMGLPEGGTTPSLGMVKVALKEVSLPIFPIIRPRSGDFIYNDLEVQQMVSDMEAFRELGVRGFVLGALTTTGTLDYNINHRLIQAAEGLPVTLHRAFDMTRDLDEALDQAIELGFSRILTSGGRSTAILGAERIAILAKKAGPHITIMAGSGITSENAYDLVIKTGVTEIHGTFQTVIKSPSLFQNHEASLQSNTMVSSYDYPQTDLRKIHSLKESFR